MDRTAFAMAQQDVRYYLNGLLLDLREHSLRCVATDGHRLALGETPLVPRRQHAAQIIMPRKGVLELQGLFEAGDGAVELEFGRNHLRVRRDDVTFTSKLIDGRFPDYEAVIPIGADKEVRVDRDELRAALQRAAILSNEKYRGVKLEVSPNSCASSRTTRSRKRRSRKLEAKTSGRRPRGRLQRQLPARCAQRAASATRCCSCLRDGNSSCLLREPDSDADAARDHAAAPLIESAAARVNPGRHAARSFLPRPG